MTHWIPSIIFFALVAIVGFYFAATEGKTNNRLR